MAVYEKSNSKGSGVSGIAPAGNIIRETVFD